MRARELMSTPVITVTPKTSVKQAAILLSSHGFTALPVVDDDDRLIGIVTEVDIVQDRFTRDLRYYHAYTDYVTGTVDDFIPTVPATVGAVTRLRQSLLSAGQ